MSELDDRAAIERLHYDYAYAIDTPVEGPDADAVAACFTVDGRFNSNGPIHEGRSAIRATFAAQSGPTRAVGRTMHYMTNIRIDLAGDRATTTALLNSFVSARPTSATPDPGWALRALTYESKCLKVDGKWLFDELVLTFLFGDPYPTLGD